MSNYAVCMCHKVTALEESVGHERDYSKSISIGNYTGHAIVVLERNGLPVTIPPNNVVNGTIVFNVVTDVVPNATYDPHNLYHQYATHDTESSAILKAISLVRDPKMTINYSRFGGARRQLRLKYELNKDIFTTHGRDIYLMDLDIMLSVAKQGDYAFHPYSSASVRMNQVFGEVNGELEDKFHQSMVIVSNNGEVGAKFINFCGHVHRIPSIRNKKLQDGFYIYGVLPTKLDIRPMEDGLRLTIKEATDMYRLYDTAEEAEKYGDPSKDAEIELEKLKRESKELDAQLKKERLQHEAEVEKLKRESDWDDLERQSRMREEKEKMEYRSYWRKDTSELLKMIPTIITAIVSIIAIFVKIKA